MSDTRLYAVTITAPEEDWLVTFVRSLVTDRLCAGAHITSPIRAVYRWEGQVYDRAETHVTLHTRAECVAAIVARADEQHPYEVPCVVATEIIDGGPAYTAWVIAQTSPEA